MTNKYTDQIDKFPVIDWSEIATRDRETSSKKVGFDADNSKLTEEDTIELGRKINKSALDEFLKDSIRR